MAPGAGSDEVRAAQPLPAAVQVVLLRLDFARASQPPEEAQDVPQLGLESVHHRVARSHGPEERGWWGLRHAPIRPRQERAASPSNGLGQRPRATAGPRGAAAVQALGALRAPG